jgi:hypothetical protein
VERCGQGTMVYVIDFYAGGGGASAASGTGNNISFYLDVRPTALSPRGVWDRAKMAWHQLWSK